MVPNVPSLNPFASAVVRPPDINNPDPPPVTLRYAGSLSALKMSSVPYDLTGAGVKDGEPPTPTPTATFTPTPTPTASPTPTATPTTTPTYSISGRVAYEKPDATPSPIPGVTVSDGAGHTATTDSNGNYTISGLPPGTYIITPSKDKHTFSPKSRTVAVPPNAAGQDFEGFDRPPIVFVHGWMGLAVSLSCAQANPDSYFGGLDNELGKVYHVEYARLQSSWCYTPSVESNVWRLKSAIDRAKAATGQPKVILIAHSMGGLVSRAYIENKALYEKDVQALFTFGTPHQGVPADVLAFLANGVSLGTYCKYQMAVCDMSEYGMRLFNLAHPKRTAGVKYYVISGNAPFLSRNVWGKIMDAIILGPDDGIVPTSSGMGLSGVSVSGSTDEVHFPPFGARSYFIRDGGTSLSYSRYLKPVLVDKPPGTFGAVRPFQETSDPTPTLAQRVPFESGTLLPGQTVTRSIPLGSGPALFAAQWQTGTLTVTLVDPTLQRIDPAYASSHPDFVSYQSEATAATYYVTSTVLGAWQLVLQGTSVGAEGTPYTTFAAFDSDMALAGATDKPWYTSGASAAITATLSGSPASAIITATILRPDGVTNTVALAPLGAGQYGATYTVPTTPGYAEVRLAASSATGGGAPFERGATLAFQIAPKSVALTGVYTDTPQPRSPGSLFYDALTVTIGVNVTVSGTYGLSANLVSADGEVVAYGATSQEIITGTGTLALRFDAGSIYASQRNGPYTLTNLLLTDKSAAALVVTEERNVYSTAAYDYRRFGRGEVYMSEVHLPLVLKNQASGW
ncbi:MAG: alpha/beta fold hydrolase [Dehalococcoidia bacterium]|nr:alpha/beta fold hydrolase [Dehalococcoidia bacterium]